MTRSIFFIILQILGGLFLVGCSGSVANPEPTGTVTIEPLTITPTPTIDWFPATATPTPRPTLEPSPTPNYSPLLGENLLVDDFSTSTDWDLTKNAFGQISIAQNELNVSIQTGRTSLSSLRAQPDATDFYLEVTANPGLCRGLDAYGVIFRAVSVQDYYRYVISCDGQMRLERVRNGRAEVTADWQPGSALLPGAPLAHTIGIAMQGQEMRLFIDGIYQFTQRDSVFTHGRFGLFARPGGDTAVTVSFTDFKLYALQGLPALPTQTPTPTITPRPK